MTVTPLGRDQDCSLKIREPDVPAPWFLDSGGWSKTAAVSLYFIFPGICTLSLTIVIESQAHSLSRKVVVPIHLHTKVALQLELAHTFSKPKNIAKRNG
ncbi:hypothetical protein STEG23_029382 [Scotinomys teguina]